MNEAVEDQAWGQVALEMDDSRWSRQTPERSKRLRLRMLKLADRDDQELSCIKVKNVLLMHHQENLSEWKTKSPTKVTQRKNLTNNSV